MKKYQITLGSNNSFRIVMPEKQSHGGSIVISGLISPVFFGGDMSLLLETVHGIIKASITPSTNSIDSELLISALDAIQSIYPAINSDELEIGFEVQGLVDVYCDFKTMELALHTDEADLYVAKLAYVSDWSPFYMGDLENMIMDEMLFTEVV